MPTRKPSPTSTSSTRKDDFIYEVVRLAIKSQSPGIAEYRGITVADMTKLRAKAREGGVTLRLLENSPVSRAFPGPLNEDVTNSVAGPLQYEFTLDPVSAAKAVAEFARLNPKFILRRGVIDVAVFVEQDIRDLAALPIREVLLTHLENSLKFPVQRLVSAIAAVAAKKAADLGTFAKKNHAQIELARQRGVAARMLVATSSEVADLRSVSEFFDISPIDVIDRVRKRLLIGLESPAAEGGYVFPRWQFHKALMLKIPEILQVFSSFDGWTVRYFMHSPSLELGECSPLEYFDSRLISKQLSLAEIVALQISEELHTNAATILEVAKRTVAEQH